MAEEELVDAERTLAKRTNGEVWALIEQPARTPAEDRMILRVAHTSAYLWAQVGGPEQWTRAEWLVSRVRAPRPLR